MKPERLKELAERLAKAMPEQFEMNYRFAPEWALRDLRTLDAWSDDGPNAWWSIIGPLLDELDVSPQLIGSLYDEDDSRDTWLEAAFAAVVEKAEYKEKK